MRDTRAAINWMNQEETVDIELFFFLKKKYLFISFQFFSWLF